MITNINNEKKYYFIFDVDDTLTNPKSVIDYETTLIINKLSKYGLISIVGGGTFDNIERQLQPISDIIEYYFTENGTVTYNKDKKLIKKLNITDVLSKEYLIQLNNFILKYLSQLKLPFKRGTFIELRNGLINVSPIGRNCTLDERKLFYDYDKENNVLYNLKESLNEYISNNYNKQNLKSNNYNLIVSYGGKISLDIYPENWNKSMCLNFIECEKYNIAFFGDRIFKGGNDYAIAKDKRVNIYYKILNNNHLKEVLNDLLYKFYK